mmetsp:Transcript_43578/g.57719  ORF Transcript_43578/g.57719 Transcript_43578/m.57719 type:complete len:211 (-) Transcript_43578:639-1271(-)
MGVARHLPRVQLLRHSRKNSLSALLNADTRVSYHALGVVDFVNQRVLRQLMCLGNEALVTHVEALLVHQSQFLARLLLLSNFVFKLGDVKHECVDFGGPLDEDFALEVGSKGNLLLLHARLELLVRYGAPRSKQPGHLLAIQGVARVGCQPGLPLVNAEVEAPGFPDCALAEQVILCREKASQAALLLLLCAIEFSGVVDLSLDCHVHLD